MVGWWGGMGGGWGVGGGGWGWVRRSDVVWDWLGRQEVRMRLVS